ncbi:hypothetical protein AGLY_002015 [Aphis glycines]|uniref:Uncharacterized protein n=1 Tax=Aphis glycines TaxID=307491 RepID=A0A6G0U3U7_APHGL|nr:hypothetical protein AGLY_002015 [Aphis glycines]
MSYDYKCPDLCDYSMIVNLPVISGPKVSSGPRSKFVLSTGYAGYGENMAIKSSCRHLLLLVGCRLLFFITELVVRQRRQPVNDLNNAFPFSTYIRVGYRVECECVTSSRRGSNVATTVRRHFKRTMKSEEEKEAELMKNARVKVLEEIVSLQNKTICDMSIYCVYDIRTTQRSFSLLGRVYVVFE